MPLPAVSTTYSSDSSSARRLQSVVSSSTKRMRGLPGSEARGVWFGITGRQATDQGGSLNARSSQRFPLAHTGPHTRLFVAGLWSRAGRNGPLSLQD